jgi:hypothetical protein
MSYKNILIIQLLLIIVGVIIFFTNGFGLIDLFIIKYLLLLVILFLMWYIQKFKK